MVSEARDEGELDALAAARLIRAIAEAEAVIMSLEGQRAALRALFLAPYIAGIATALIVAGVLSGWFGPFDRNERLLTAVLGGAVLVLEFASMIWLHAQAREASDLAFALKEKALHAKEELHR